MKKINPITSKLFVIYAEKILVPTTMTLHLKKNHEVRNHCHYTGKYRGTTHDIYNLRYKTPKENPEVFHNSSKYDYHFI